jgi:hypothetical protein
MDPSMMRAATEMMKNMPPDQISKLMSSMGNMSPDMMAQAQSMASRMTPEDLQRAQEAMAGMSPQDMAAQASQASSMLSAQSKYILTVRLVYATISSRTRAVLHSYMLLGDLLASSSMAQKIRAVSLAVRVASSSEMR